MAPRNNGQDQFDDEDLEGLDLEGQDEGEADVDEDDGEADEGQGEGRQARQEDDLLDDRKPTRGERRFQALTEAARAAEERAARAERQVQEFLQNQRQQQQQTDPRLEQERLALMTPEERIEYRFQQSEERHRRETAAMEARMADQADQTRYQARAANNPIYAKYADEVETAHQDLRSKGQFVAREAILKFKLGEKMLERALTAAPKQRKQGKQNIERQRTRPVSGRQDVAADRRRQGDTPASRLDGVSI